MLHALMFEHSSLHLQQHPKKQVWEIACLVMSVSRTFRLLSRRAISHNARSSMASRRRSFATPSNAEAAGLPLAGIKVLDMTRVLAGVRESFLDWSLSVH